MKITVSQIAPSREGLRLGLRIEHEKAHWVRFGVTVLALDRLTYAERQLLLSWLEDARTAEDWESDTPFDLRFFTREASVIERGRRRRNGE